MCTYRVEGYEVDGQASVVMEGLFKLKAAPFRNSIQMGEVAGAHGTKSSDLFVTFGQTFRKRISADALFVSTCTTVMSSVSEGHSHSYNKA